MKARKQKEPAGMNPSEIFAALTLLEQERGIPKAFMLDKITQAIVSAYKKDHPDTENVEVEADEESQTLRMFVKKNVVDEEDYVDPFNEMPLEEAKRISA
ncbi:MAG: transcription termination/antitermination protein NusA, partial [Oscillibacter sp.]|nr:transcription termination/antitermination protein NusA [Oscillibacter sp.]